MCASVVVCVVMLRTRRSGRPRPLSPGSTNLTDEEARSNPARFRVLAGEFPGRVQFSHRPLKLAVEVTLDSTPISGYHRGTSCRGASVYHNI
jgi:hypothetical protein